MGRAVAVDLLCSFRCPEFVGRTAVAYRRRRSSTFAASPLLRPPGHRLMRGLWFDIRLDLVRSVGRPSPPSSTCNQASIYCKHDDAREDQTDRRNDSYRPELAPCQCLGLAWQVHWTWMDELCLWD